MVTNGRMPLPKKTLRQQIESAGVGAAAVIFVIVGMILVILMAFGLFIASIAILAHNIIEVQQYGWDFWRAFWIILSGFYLLVSALGTLKNAVRKSS